MSKYTTGEIAKLCGVSVRTVQYYDTRAILTPSELSEGGRRLYSEDDLRRLKVICFLRSIDLPINTIGQLLQEENPGSVISLLLDQQEQVLREELSERQEKLRILEELKQELKSVKNFSVESIGDIAYQMENKKKLRKVRWTMLSVGIPLEIIEIATLALGIKTGIWWPFILGLIIEIIGGVWLSRYYFSHVDYICPECHEIFHPKFKELFWANHTPTTRKLTCPKCGRKGFCVETYGGPKKEEN
ncbi:MAG: MerR family transcriptional regulator [Clostridia bacterium]|nr:MerR family transcriptional regulator [Clostridia bacterium]